MKVRIKPPLESVDLLELGPGAPFRLVNTDMNGCSDDPEAIYCAIEWTSEIAAGDDTASIVDLCTWTRYSLYTNAQVYPVQGEFVEIGADDEG